MAGINSLGLPNPQRLLSEGTQTKAPSATDTPKSGVADARPSANLGNLTEMSPQELDVMLGSLLQTLQSLLGISGRSARKDISPARAYLRSMGAFMVRPLEKSQAKVKPEAQVFAGYDSY